AWGSIRTAMRSFSRRGTPAIRQRFHGRGLRGLRTPGYHQNHSFLLKWSQIGRNGLCEKLQVPRESPGAGKSAPDGASAGGRGPAVNAGEGTPRPGWDWKSASSCRMIGRSRSRYLPRPKRPRRTITEDSHATAQYAIICRRVPPSYAGALV